MAKLIPIYFPPMTLEIQSNKLSDLFFIQIANTTPTKNHLGHHMSKDGP